MRRSYRPLLALQKVLILSSSPPLLLSSSLPLLFSCSPPLLLSSSPPLLLPSSSPPPPFLLSPRGPSGRPRGPFWPYFGGPWASFQAIEASFSKLARAPPDNRKQSSKSLVKRSSLGLACVWGQKTQPRRGSSRFLRPRRLTLRIQLASQACFFTRRTSKTFGFYVVPCFPRLSSPTRGSPRPEITRKCCSKSPVKRSFKTAAGQKQTRTMARWPGFGGACPTGDPATEPLRLKRGP